MIAAIVRTAFLALRRDRGALVMSFVLPVSFFSIFAVIFGGDRQSGLPRVSVIVVDLDLSSPSRLLVQALEAESALNVLTHREKDEKDGPLYTMATAEDAVKLGVVPAALVIPQGYGQAPLGGVPGRAPQRLVLLHDRADLVAAPMIAGLLQSLVSRPPGSASPASPGIVVVRDVVGERKRSPMVSFYAAGIGVMFLLFTASAAGGALLDEAEIGTLERVLSARVSMTTFLAGKTVYCTLLAVCQLTVMFVWGWAVFHLELLNHLPGFFVMTVVTAFACASFGMVLASLARTRAQQGSISTLLILTMSALGGSMFPRYFMPEAVQKIGLLTFNAWAIDGFTKVFWRDQGVLDLGPQVAVLVIGGLVLLVLARRLAVRWEQV